MADMIVGALLVGAGYYLGLSSAQRHIAQWTAANALPVTLQLIDEVQKRRAATPPTAALPEKP